MKKFMLLVSLLAVMSFGFSTNVVPVGDAVRVSKNFLSERIGSMEAQNYSITLVQTEYATDGTPVYYRFQVGDKGFIIISATDQVAPVLAYSLESNFTNGPAAAYLCSRYQAELSEVVAMPSPKGRNAEWDRYLSDNFQLRQTKGAPSMEPLVTTTWTQNPYYNAECPYNPRTKYDGDDKRAPVGCVALTMANIMFYYRYPESGYGGMMYIPVEYDDNTGEVLYTYPPQQANFALSSYNYDAIPNKLESYNHELAHLLYQCGVATKMGYGHDGSGTQSEYALNALQGNFFYAQNAQFQNLTDVVTDTSSYASTLPIWEERLLTELDNRRPVFYSGRSKAAGGHAWIVDGYTTVDSTHFFHVNWGWAGSDNGFYRLRNMNTSGYGNFNYQFKEAMMLRLQPSDTNAIAKPTTGSKRITAAHGTISDGAGNVKYAPNTNRSWVFACPDARTYQFKFSKLKLKNGDQVKIYNGGTQASGVKQTYTGEYLMAACSDYNAQTGSTHGDFTGQTLPNAITVTADSVLVEFISNSDDETSYGFVLDYEVTAYTINTCDLITPFNNVYSGVITDKKNNVESDDHYRASTVCQYRLNGLKYSTGYYVAFPKFELKAGDYVEFYDLNSSLAISPDGRDFIVRYDMNNLPAGVINIPATDVLIRFVSDNWQQGTGFKMNFYGNLGVDQHSNFEDVTIFPNPATENLFVKLTAEAQDVKATVLDLTGKVVYVDMFNHAGGEQQYTLPVNTLANGIYFLNLQGNDGGKVTYKFIVK